jgi:hypothetical protein
LQPVENDDGANRDYGRRNASGDEGAHGQIPSGSVALQQQRYSNNRDRRRP